GQSGAIHVAVGSGAIWTAKFLPSLQGTLQYARPLYLAVDTTPIANTDSPWQSLIPFVSIAACSWGGSTKRRSLAAFPDPAAIAAKLEPAAISAASSNGLPSTLRLFANPTEPIATR